MSLIRIFHLANSVKSKATQRQNMLPIRIRYYLFIWLHHVAYGILVPYPGIEPAPSALESQRMPILDCLGCPQDKVLFL